MSSTPFGSDPRPPRLEEPVSTARQGRTKKDNGYGCPCSRLMSVTPDRQTDTTRSGTSVSRPGTSGGSGGGWGGPTRSH